MPQQTGEVKAPQALLAASQGTRVECPLFEMLGTLCFRGMHRLHICTDLPLGCMFLTEYPKSITRVFIGQ